MEPNPSNFSTFYLRTSQLYATFSSKSNRFLRIKGQRGLSPEIDLNKRGYKTGHVYAICFGHSQGLNDFGIFE